MKTVRTVAAFLACIGMAVPSSACCFLPWFPGFGYGGYGYGHGCGYAPAPPVYRASYAPAMSNTCCSPCGSSCGTSCAGGSCSNCAPTEIRNKAVPDPISNEGRDDRDRDYRERDQQFGSDREDYDDDPRNRGGAGADNFGGNTRDWNSPDSDRTNDDIGGGANSSDAVPPFDNSDIPGMDGFNRSQRPPMGDFGNDANDATDVNDEAGAGDDAGVESILNRGANKPPINVPVEETSTEASGAAGADVQPGSETDSSEFLGPDSSGSEDESTDGAFRSRLLSKRAARSSHYGILSAERLAGSRSDVRARSTAVSSSVRKQTPVRWISLPAPAGRVRS